MLPVQLMVAPLRRLGVNKPTPIEKVGSQDSVLSSIGAYITGELCAHEITCRGNLSIHSIPLCARSLSWLDSLLAAGFVPCP